MNSNKLYVHEVFTEDEIKDNSFQTVAQSLNSKPHGGNVLYKSILTDFLNKDNTVSKVVDENGEPLVVYHQTRNMFDSFDVRHEGAGRNDSETPYGVFLKPNAEDIGFGDIQMPLFARVCNPLRFKNREQLAYWAKKEVKGYAELADRLQALDADYEKRSATAEQQENELYEEMWKAQERGELSDEEYEAKAAELEENGAWGRVLKEWQETAGAVRHEMKEVLDAAVRSSGYDGFLLDTDAGVFGRKVSTIVALTPHQVKSATDNNGAFSPDDVNIYHQKDSLDNDMADSDNENRISDAVFQKYLNDGIMEMVRDRVSAEITEHVNLADMADPIKRDAARDSLPSIKKMLVWYNQNIVQDNEAYKNRLAVRIEYARRCFDLDERIQERSRSVRTIDGDNRSGGIDQNRNDAVSVNDARRGGESNRRSPRGVSRAVSGERSGARAHFEKLYNDMQKHLESQGAFSIPKSFNQSAWHGSPHDFVEFLLSAIGTGEGAQAHGWGLYFAKAKKTAASYRGRLSSKNELEIVYDGKKSW